jgi:hypothetical protein
MYGKPAMTCFKYQVYLYGPEAITCYTLSGYRASIMSHPLSPNPHHRHHPPPPPCVAEEPTPIWKRTLVWLNCHICIIQQREKNLVG